MNKRMAGPDLKRKQPRKNAAAVIGSQTYFLSWKRGSVDAIMAVICSLSHALLSSTSP